MLINVYIDNFMTTNLKDKAENTFEVLAISKCRGKKWYLIDVCRSLRWIEESDVEILKYDIPQGWIKRKFNRFHKLKNSNYDFYIRLQEYQGPNLFIEDIDLFFDIIENPSVAYGIYCKNTNQKSRTVFVNNQELCIDACYKGIGKYVGLPIITITRAMNIDLLLNVPPDYNAFRYIDENYLLYNVKIHPTNSISSCIYADGIWEEVNSNNTINDLFVSLPTLKSVLSFLKIDAEIICTNESIAIWNRT